MATKSETSRQYVYNIHCLQKANGMLGKGTHEGRTWSPNPGTFETVEEAEAYCSHHTNEHTIYWWEKSLVGKFEVKKRRKKK